MFVLGLVCINFAHLWRSVCVSVLVCTDSFVKYRLTAFLVITKMQNIGVRMCVHSVRREK